MSPLTAADQRTMTSQAVRRASPAWLRVRGGCDTVDRPLEGATVRLCPRQVRETARRQTVRHPPGHWRRCGAHACRQVPAQLPSPRIAIIWRCCLRRAGLATATERRAPGSEARTTPLPGRGQPCHTMAARETGANQVQINSGAAPRPRNPAAAPQRRRRSRRRRCQQQHRARAALAARPARAAARRWRQSAPPRAAAMRAARTAGAGPSSQTAPAAGRRPAGEGRWGPAGEGRAGARPAPPPAARRQARPRPHLEQRAQAELVVVHGRHAAARRLDRGARRLARRADLQVQRARHPVRALGAAAGVGWGGGRGRGR